MANCGVGVAAAIGDFAQTVIDLERFRELALDDFVVFDGVVEFVSAQGSDRAVKDGGVIICFDRQNPIKGFDGFRVIRQFNQEAAFVQPARGVVGRDDEHAFGDGKGIGRDSRFAGDGGFGSGV